MAHGITSASARELVQFTLRTYYTSDRCHATMVELQSFGMSADFVPDMLYKCPELLTFPPETIPSRLKNVCRLTSMSHCQATTACPGYELFDVQRRDHIRIGQNTCWYAAYNPQLQTM